MTHTELPALTGSDKQIEWATSLRASFVKLLSDPYAPQTEYVEKAKLITDASWWIDQRHLLAGGQLPNAAKNIKRAIRSRIRQAQDA